MLYNVRWALAFALFLSVPSDAPIWDAGACINTTFTQSEQMADHSGTLWPDFAGK